MIPNPLHESLLKEFRDECPPPCCPKCGKEMSYKHGEVVFCEDHDEKILLRRETYESAIHVPGIMTDSIFEFAFDIVPVQKKWVVRDFSGIVDCSIGFRPDKPAPKWVTYSINIIGVKRVYT